MKTTTDKDRIPKAPIGWTVWLYGALAIAVIVLTIVGFAISSRSV
jgi:hypothetical protein